MNATEIAALSDSDWTNTSFDGEQGSGILTNLNPSPTDPDASLTTYQIQARPRNTLGVLGVFGPIGDSTKVSETTIPLASIFEIEVNLISNTGGSVFKNGVASTEKQLTATVTKVNEIGNDLADPDTF